MKAIDLYEKLKGVDTGVCSYTLDRCEEWITTINKINELKKEKKAIVLAHTYVNPEIIYSVADHVGDSYFLSDIARKSDAEIIIFVAVKFMAETAKILNPMKRVFQTNTNGGCSLADSITGEDVALLKKNHPDHTFICYINTTAAVKAECDVCVTSSNVYDIVANLSNDKVYFLPDRLMAQNVIADLKERGIDKEVLYTDGSCYVHETYDPEMIDYLRLKYPGVSVAVHPECTPEVTAKADFVGSTSGIYNHVKSSSANAFALVTECGLSSRLRVDEPDKKIVGSCTFCRHMQGNDLDIILNTLNHESKDMEITLDSKLAERARNCIDQMFEQVENNKAKAVVKEQI